MKTPEELYNQLFVKNVSGKAYEDYCFEDTSCGKEKVLERVAVLQNEYKKVTTGYFTTSVRGYHLYVILYKN